jgi:hypothetical protein
MAGNGTVAELCQPSPDWRSIPVPAGVWKRRNDGRHYLQPRVCSGTAHVRLGHVVLQRKPDLHCGFGSLPSVLGRAVRRWNTTDIPGNQLGRRSLCVARLGAVLRRKSRTSQSGMRGRRGDKIRIVRGCIREKRESLGGVAPFCCWWPSASGRWCQPSILATFGVGLHPISHYTLPVEIVL